MNSTDLNDAVAAHVSMSKSEVAKVIKGLVETITATLKKNDEVTVHGLGKFVAKSSLEKKGRNPRTGEAITIPASVKASFKAGKVVNDALKA